MKKKLLTLCSFLFVLFANAQVGVNTTTPQASLDITAKNPTGNTTEAEGLLIPRVDRQRAQSMTGVPTSTLIYVNDIATGTASGTAIDVTTIGYYYFNGTKWVLLSVNNNNDWQLTGNSGTTPGTHFLGTTDNNPIVFKTNNLQAGWLGDNTNTSYGLGALPMSTTGTYNSAIGVNSLASNSSGSSNTALGSYALSSNTTGENNTVTGSSALAQNTTGIDNTAIGLHSMYSNTAGNNNSALGSRSLLSTTGSNNTAIGHNAGESLSTGNNNIMIGANTNVTSNTSDNQMNIGNAIFGNNMNGTSAAPAGNIGIGNNTPTNRLHVTAPTDPLKLEGLQNGDAYTEQILVVSPTGVVKQGGALTNLSIPAPAIFSLTANIPNFLFGYGSGSSQVTPMTMIKNGIPGLTYDSNTSTITFPAGTYQITYNYEAIDVSGCTISSYIVDFPTGASAIQRVHSTAMHSAGAASNHGGTITLAVILPAGRTWTIALGRGQSGNCGNLGNGLAENSTQLIVYRLGD